MAVFWRIYNNKLMSAGEVDNLGFSVDNLSYIPDSYLMNKKFVIMRTCHGIGDWAIISAMPRLLKSKYKDCKVYVPSRRMLKTIYGEMLQTWGYGVYDCTKVVEDVFLNNPYIDGQVDEVEGDIFHDHYRIYDKYNTKIPLLEQMLFFWQFKKNEILDSSPDIYFCEKEIDFGNNLIKKYFKNNYGYMLLSSTYGLTAKTETLFKKVKSLGDNYPWFYYGEKDISDTEFNFLSNTVNVKELDLSVRQQMYLKCKAKLNVGNETGLNEWSSKYSPSYLLANEYYGPISNKPGKPRKDPWSSGNFVRTSKYMNI